jgi:hypothetical protein
MQNRHSEPAGQLSKLISALQKQWREELGGPEAPATEAALKRAQDLLTAVRDGSAPRLLAESTVHGYLGEAWLTANPWAGPHVQRIEAAIRAADSA